MAEFRDYRVLQERLAALLSDKASPEILREIIKRVIHRIEIGPDFVEVKYIVGKSEISLVNMDMDSRNQEGSGPSSKILCGGSQSLTYGAPQNKAASESWLFYFVRCAQQTQYFRGEGHESVWSVRSDHLRSN